MRNLAICKALLTILVCAGPALAHAADAQAAQGQPAPQPGGPSESPVVEPQVERREFKIVHVPSNDWELGVFTGSYSTEYFGTDLVWGGRLGYHVTEDVFAEAVYGQTRATDEVYRQILPGGIFTNPKVALRYYDLSLGLNVLPGEVYFWKSTARVSALYLIAGLGGTDLANQWHMTVNAGVGMRIWLRDWVALQGDLRDHIFSTDVLGQQRTTQNLEFTGGATFFF